MAILLLADHDNASLSDQTAKALTAASQIGGDVHILVAGKAAKGAADSASRLSGVSRVLLAESDELANGLAEPLAALIYSLAADYDTIIAAATSTGKNVLPRVAALLDVAQVSEIIEVVSSDTFKRPIYAGNAIQIVQSTDAKKVITVRNGLVFPRLPRPSCCRRRDLDGSLFLPRSRRSVDAPVDSNRPNSLGRVIISGGRALGSSESSEVILPSPTSSVPPSAHPARPSMRLCAE